MLNLHHSLTFAFFVGTNEGFLILANNVSSAESAIVFDQLIDDCRFRLRISAISQDPQCCLKKEKDDAILKRMSVKRVSTAIERHQTAKVDLRTTIEDGPSESDDCFRY